MDVFKIEDAERHWVIAADANDAVLVMLESEMADAESAAEYLARESPRISCVPADSQISVRDEGAGALVTKTAGEWLAEGRGYLAGSCW